MKTTFLSMFTQKNIALLIVGGIGSFIANLLGGWDLALETLIKFMIVDYAAGLILAAVFKKSNKTETGGLSSAAGWKGLCKKGMTLGIILVCAQLDKLSNTDFIRNVAIIGYIGNESISIMEKGALMGIPIPQSLIDRIDVMKGKVKKNGKNSN